MATAFGDVLKCSDLVVTVDVLVEMGRLSRKNIEDWRFGRIPCRERASPATWKGGARPPDLHLHAAASAR